jgi:hypothetical protein
MPSLVSEEEENNCQHMSGSSIQAWKRPTTSFKCYHRWWDLGLLYDPVTKQVSAEHPIISTLKKGKTHSLKCNRHASNPAFTATYIMNLTRRKCQLTLLHWHLTASVTVCTGNHLRIGIQGTGVSSGFGGLVVSMLASGTQDRGSEPGRSRWTFQGKKIHSLPSFGGEVKPSVPCRRFAARKRTLRFTWKSESQAKLTGHFSP